MSTAVRSYEFKIMTWWLKYRKTLLCLTIMIMTFAAIVWLGYEFWRLIFQIMPTGAIDLAQRYREVHYWFAGKQVYGTLSSAPYPPATYVILWPILGWLDFTPVRWLWAAIAVAALIWLIRLLLKESCADMLLERVFISLIPLSMYATGAAIGNGQLIVLILPILLAGLLLLLKGSGGWINDLLASFLIILSLVKPSIAVPFFWIVVIVPGRLRPALLVIFGYIGITIFASLFQDFSLLLLLRSWIEAAINNSSSATHSVSNLHSWMSFIGLERWITIPSLIILFVLGTWIFIYRHSDPWLLIGVTAFIARIWTYHAWYDDMLIFLPMIALFRIAKFNSATNDDNLLAGVLLGTILIAMIAPGGLYLFPSPFNLIYVAFQVVIWFAVLTFLLYYTRRKNKKAR